MFRGWRTALVCGWLMLTSIASMRAQSLADVARKEEERRKRVPEPAKVYTNKDLHSTPAPAPPPAGKTDEKAAAAKDTEKSAADRNADAKDATGKDAAEKGAAGKDPSGKDASEKPPTAQPVKDQAYWSGRLKALQEQLARDKTYAEALQSRINALNTDFVNRDDPAQKSVIERDRVRAVAELDQLKKTIPNDQKAVDSLVEEARRAGVPPGWLR